ncbi:MAG: nitroreductase/quinone reductase family protein [Aggregatilineales bacterium]
MTAAVQNKPPAVWRWLIKAQNPFMKWLLRSPLQGVVSGKYLLLTFTGRKTGTIYSTPVQYARDGELLRIITSGGYTWWKNLRGGAPVQVLLRGVSYDGDAETTVDLDGVVEVIGKVYPSLSAERRKRFAPGKVAIVVRLRKGKAL